LIKLCRKIISCPYNLLTLPEEILFRTKSAVTPFKSVTINYLSIGHSSIIKMILTGWKKFKKDE